MKNLLLFVCSALLLVACGKDDEPKSKMLDPNTMLKFNIKTSVTSRSGKQALSPKEMLEQAAHFQFYDAEMIALGNKEPGTRKIPNWEKDFETLSFNMTGFNVVNHDTVDIYWREARDLIVVTNKMDTIGYIPQHIRNEAFERILAAEKVQNFDLIYKIFKESFVAIPCTAEEYKELKAKGLN